MEWIVPEKFHNIKVVHFLKEHVDMSASRLKNAIEQHSLLINGIVENFASKKVRKGDRVFFEERVRDSLEFCKDSVLFDDESILVYSKPAFYTSEEFQEKLFPEHKLVHRLDRETTGLIILAKSEGVKERFVESFRKKMVKKTYLAIVQGKPERDKGRISKPILRKRVDGKIQWGVGKSGKKAVTFYKVLQTKRGFSTIMCQPETGRTHQLRVHLREEKCPILGDYQYEREFQMHAPRVMLHALSLKFPHPKNGRKIELNLDPPDDFVHVQKEIFS